LLKVTLLQRIALTYYSILHDFLIIPTLAKEVQILVIVSSALLVEHED